MIRIKRSMVKEKAIDLVRTRLAEYEVSLEEDVVATITDGASVMMKFGRETEPLHFSCLAHAIHHCFCDVWYKSYAKTSDDVEDDEECEDEQECEDEGSDSEDQAALIFFLN